MISHRNQQRPALSKYSLCGPSKQPRFPQYGFPFQVQIVPSIGFSQQPQIGCILIFAKNFIACPNHPLDNPEKRAKPKRLFGFRSRPQTQSCILRNTGFHEAGKPTPLSDLHRWSIKAELGFSHEISLFALIGLRVPVPDLLPCCGVSLISSVFQFPVNRLRRVASGTSWFQCTVLLASAIAIMGSWHFPQAIKR
jgi:hypothetical protein